MLQVQLVPGDLRIIVQRRLDLAACSVDRQVDFLQGAALGIGDNLRPSLVGLAQRDRIRVAKSAITSQGLVRNLGDVGTSHDHPNACGAHRVRHPVGFRGHPRHGANPHQFHAVLANVGCQLLLAHSLRVAIHQEDLMSGRSQRLQQKHPQMGHEVVGDFVIRIIQQNVHGPRFLRTCSRRVEPRGPGAERLK